MIRIHTGISGSRTAYMLSGCLSENRKLLAVVSSGQEASRLADDLVFYLPALEPVILPEEEDMQILYEARDRSSLGKRIKAMNALLGTVPSDADAETGKVLVMVIAPVSSAVRATASPERFLSSVIRIKTGIHNFHVIIIKPGSELFVPAQTPKHFH